MLLHEQYPDVLQNIEFAIISIYRDQPDLLDYDVADALNALIQYYRHKTAPIEGREPNLHERAAAVFNSVRAMAEWRLGRQSEFVSSDGQVDPPESISQDELVQCLKYILKSVKFWNEEAGRQGYLNYVKQFII